MSTKKAARAKATSALDAPSEAALPPLAERLTFLVHTASARIANIGNRHFRDHDLNHFSARILVLLLEHGELRTGELVERMVLPQSTISSQLQALHKKRLIRRRRSRQDNRSVNLTLTEAGVELARDCNALSLRVHQEVIAGLGERERQQGFAFLHEINKRLVALETQDLYPFHGAAQPTEFAPQPRAARKSATKPGRSAAPAAPRKRNPLEQTA